MMPFLASWLCLFRNRAAWLLFLALLLLLLLFLLWEWMFYAYLTVLALLGAIGATRIALGMIEKICWKASADPKGQGSEGHPPSKGLKLPDTIYKRPDPLIYSQTYLMSRGLAVTWDNPDIDLFDPADTTLPTPVPSHSLQPGKLYNIKAWIRNGSTEAAAVNLLVRFYYLSFGIGTVRNYIAETLIDLGAKGSDKSSAFATVPWLTPASPGHYCVQAEIVWVDDANPFNNLGQKNVDVKKLNSPTATFEFLVRNTSPETRTIVLRPDSYAIPPKPPCGAMEADRRARDVSRDRFSAHRLSAYPVPAGWRVDIHDDGILTLRAGEERKTAVTITATDVFVPMQAININGYAHDRLVGGVTLYVHN